MLLRREHNVKRCEDEKSIMSGFDLFVVGLAATAGGAVNALAGGGTLITFPVLTAVGVPAVSANITNTVALCPGYLGAAFAQMKDLRGQSLRLWLLLPVGALGGIGGGVLLLNTGDQVFRKLVPFLILMAVVLLASQDRLRGAGWSVRNFFISAMKSSPYRSSLASPTPLILLISVSVTG